MKQLIIFLALVAISGATGCKKKPEPCFSLNKNLSNLHINEEITFSAGCSIDADEYAWNFGDGGTATGLTVKHVYSSPGTYDAVLTASIEGRSENITRTIELLP